jgi:predicted glycosyltransferase
VAHSNILSHREETAIVADIESSTPPGTNDSQNRSHAWRIVFYSHDTMGLGHVRRNILIARTLGSSHLQPVILMVTGIGEAAVFGIPPAADYLTLPALHKDADR